MSTKTTKIYQFKISLRGSKKPVIWRRIQVPDSYNFADLHYTIQDAMGWHNSHLHQFEMINPQTNCIQIISDPDMLDDDFNVIAEEKILISNYFIVPLQQALYEYDFGDSWEHTILFEKILPPCAKSKYPLCIAGKGRCPPEDCGGIWGYYQMLEEIKDPSNPEHKSTLQWIGEGFDPNNFDPKKVKFGMSKC